MIQSQLNAIRETVGSCWAGELKNELIGPWAAVLRELDHQLVINLQEAADCFIQRRVPLLHTERWSELVLYAHERRRAAECQYCPDNCAAQPGAVAYPLTGLVDCATLQDRVFQASWIKQAGVDFWLAPGFIFFLTDPFLDPTIGDQARASGETTLALWAYLAQQDTALLNNCLTYLTNSYGTPTLQRRDAVLAALRETSQLTVKRILAAVTRCPIAEAAGRVTAIHAATEYRGPVVVVESQAYAAGLGAVPTVTVEQQVEVGEELFDGFRWVDFSRPNSWPASFDIPQALLPPGVKQLRLVNASVVLQQATVQDEVTYTFSLGGNAVGNPEAAFFSHLRESFRPTQHTFESRVRRWYHGLTSLTGAAPSVPPAQINPLAFFAENWLRTIAVGVLVRPELIRDEDVDLIKLLRRATSLHRTVILNYLGPTPRALRDRYSPCCVV